MLASQLIHSNYPTVGLFDKISFALQLMDDYDLLHLPVVSEEKYAGLVSKDDLLDADADHTVASLEYRLTKSAIKIDEHFLIAVKLAAEMSLSLVPVINEQSELAGVIPAGDLLRVLGAFVGGEEPGGMIVLEMEKRNYSFGEITRLVETNDAYITQLNSSVEADTGLIVVTIRINKAEISDIVATFQRYEYHVRYYFGEEQYTNEVKENYDHLIAYLNI